MFRGGSGNNGPGGGGGGGGGTTPSAPASSSASNPASSAMLSFARALGMAPKPVPSQPAAPPPSDLPNPQTPNNAADTNSVFYVDDTLSELARVRRYSLSQLPLQRLVYVKRIAACARSVGLAEALTQLLPLFQKLVVDQEAVVRTAAATELANMSHFLADPNLPWIPNPTPAQTNASLYPSQKPPTTVQSPDLTLEDDVIPDIDVNDVDNSLASVNAAATTAAATTTSETAGTAATNPDAMEVDSVATPSPPSNKSALADSDSDPMDTSTETDAHVTTSDSEPIISEPEQKAPEPAAEAAKPASPVANTSPAASPAAPPAAAAAAPSSPLSIAVAAPAAASSSSQQQPHTPLSDPTSTIRMDAYEQIKETIIPCLQTLILDNNAEVRAAACDSLVRVADVLRGDDVGKVVLTLVLNLAHDERDEQRTTAVHLMHELAPRLGHDLCRSFVALELAAFADDSTFRVRKATAQSFGNVCEMVGEQFTVQKLLPCYVRLSKDIIWGTRASAAKSIVAVTKVVGPAVRQEVLIPMFLRFAKDSSRWVRNGAYEILGPFLHALGPELASKELVTYFANIPTMSSAIVDQEVNYHAAFNFPAVLQTIGRERWSEIEPCFQALAKDQKFPVRRTLAYSLHELAAMLGPALTESSLIPVFDSFLRDLDEVRYGVLKNFAAILKGMTVEKRVLYLEVLWLVQKQNENWRWRLLWAKQLGMFAKLFSAQHTITDIMPLSFALCRDQVAAVRTTAAKALGRLLSRFLSFPTPNTVVAPLISLIHSFASSTTFMERQLYLRMVEGFIGVIPQELFEEFLQRAVPLAQDKTSNVRLACVQSMKALLADPSIHSSPSAAKIIAALSNDAHKDVQKSMREAIQQASGGAAATSALASSLSSLALATASPSLSAAAPSSQSEALTDADLDDILAGPSSVPSSSLVPASPSSAGAPHTPPGGAHVVPVAAHSIDEVSPPSLAATSEALLSPNQHHHHANEQAITPAASPADQDTPVED